MADIEKEVGVRINRIEKKVSSFQREIAQEISGLKSWFKKQLLQQAQNGSASSKSASRSKAKASPKKKDVNSESESSSEEDVEEIESQPALPRGAQTLDDFLKNKIPVINLRKIPADFHKYSLEFLENKYSPIPVLTSTNEKYNFRRRFKANGSAVDITSDDNEDADDESDEPSSSGKSKKVPDPSSLPRKGILKVRTFNNELIVIDSEYDGLRKSTRIGTPNGQSTSKKNEEKSKSQSRNDNSSSSSSSSSDDQDSNSTPKTSRQNRKKTSTKSKSDSNRDSKTKAVKKYDSDEESTEVSDSDSETEKASGKKESVRRKLRFADNDTYSESKEKVSKKYNKSPMPFRAATKRPVNNEDSTEDEDEDSDVAWDPKNADDENPMKRARKKLKWGNL